MAKMRKLGIPSDFRGKATRKHPNPLRPKKNQGLNPRANFEFWWELPSDFPIPSPRKFVGEQMKIGHAIREAPRYSTVFLGRGILDVR
jgi:hypothetical protein